MEISRSGLLLRALVIFYWSLIAVLGQQSAIFQYGGDKQNYELWLEVPGDRSVDITEIYNENITCLGDFRQSDGGLLLTTAGSNTGNVSGRCLYSTSVMVQKCSSPPISTSFSTTFQIMTNLPFGSKRTPQGVAFIIASDLSTQGQGGGFLGWLNSSTNNQTSPPGPNFAVEIDLFQDLDFHDPVGSHVGVDKNSLTSLNTTGWLSAMNGIFGYGSPIDPLFSFNGSGTISRSVWVEYHGTTQMLNVFVSDEGAAGAPIEGSHGFVFQKPTTPSLSTVVELTDTFSVNGMFVGFSGSISNNGTVAVGDEDMSFTILEWTFNSDGLAPDVPRNPDGSPFDTWDRDNRRRKRRIITIVVITVPSVAVFLVLVIIIFVLYRRNARLLAIARKYEIEEVLDRGPQSFRYRVLSSATKGFSSEYLLGSGGFGSVYKGHLVLKGDDIPTQVAVKRISATSNQGAQEFLAEVKIIGRAQHRNLVRLLGWCHERGELLLVYDYMPNGSVDQHLYNSSSTADYATAGGEPVLTWSRRLKIVSGVASALAYLHEEWEQRVIHRDVKSSNVMLDNDFNARLGDFGLARLSEHDQAPASTVVVAGTYGYMAPELGQTLKPTEKTDVYSFGAMVLEVATGKKPLLSLKDRQSLNEILLLNWVWSLYSDDALLEAADCALQNAYDPQEMAMFLKIGLLCSHPNPDERPTMREVINIWKGLTPFPPLPRSKPIPVYPSEVGRLGLHTDLDADTIAFCSTDDFGGTDMFQDSTPSRGPSTSSAGHTSLRILSGAVDGDSVQLERLDAGKSISRNLSLRFRVRSASLPF